MSPFIRNACINDKKQTKQNSCKRTAAYVVIIINEISLEWSNVMTFDRIMSRTVAMERTIVKFAISFEYHQLAPHRIYQRNSQADFCVDFCAFHAFLLWLHSEYMEKQARLLIFIQTVSSIHVYLPKCILTLELAYCLMTFWHKCMSFFRPKRTL